MHIKYKCLGDAGSEIEKYGPRSVGGRSETIDWRGAHVPRRHQADAPAAEIVTLETSKETLAGGRRAAAGEDLSARACAKNRWLFVESSQPRVINIFKTHKQPTDSITRQWKWRSTTCRHEPSRQL